MVDAFGSVRTFEKELSKYTNAPYVVTVDSCSSALSLCCHYPFLEINEIPEIEIPAKTYPSTASAIVHAGGRIKFYNDNSWQKIGWYELSPTGIIDSAKYLARGMFSEFKQKLNYRYLYICLSFHVKKSLPIGRGGAILTDDEKGMKWLKAARFNGRHEKPLQEDFLVMAGWNCYMTPEQASRGLTLMQFLSDSNILESDPYTDLSKYDFFTKANR